MAISNVGPGYNHGASVAVQHAKGKPPEHSNSALLRTPPEDGADSSTRVKLHGRNAGEALTYPDPRKGGSTPPAETTDPAASPDASGTVSNAEDLQALLDESQQQADQIISLLRGLIEQQGLDWQKVASGEQQLQADPQTIEAAKQAISDDGEFGVRKVAERILNFVKAGLGDDPSKLATLRDAVQQGFDEAQQMLGGTLPEISQRTRDAIMAEFDRWEKEGIPSGTISLASTPSTGAAPASA